MSIRIAGELVQQAIAEERERCAKIVERACNPEGDDDLAERAAEAFNSGYPKKLMASRIEAFGEVIAAAIRAGDGEETDHG